MPDNSFSGDLGEIRTLRRRLRLSQSAFAQLLCISAETYRAWDSGRRAVPDQWLDKARALVAARDPERLWSLQALANELGVHVRTLRDAARAGRLEVIYGNRVAFRNPVPKATLAAGRAFVQTYYRQSYSRFAIKPPVPERSHVPLDWPHHLRRVRRELGLTQSQLALHVGVAGKAVVYQWECGKRKPSPVLWSRVEDLLEHSRLRSVVQVTSVPKSE